MKAEGTRETGVAYVVAIVPDVCFTPMGATTVPVPYPIIGFFSNVTLLAKSVRMCGRPVFTNTSKVTTVIGDEAGTAGGVQSSVNKSVCESVTASTTVRAEGNRVLRHGDTMKMNKGNTIGTVIFLPLLGPLIVGAPSGKKILGTSEDVWERMTSNHKSTDFAKNVLSNIADVGIGLGKQVGTNFKRTARMMAGDSSTIGEWFDEAMQRDNPVNLFMPYVEAYQKEGIDGLGAKLTADMIVALLTEGVMKGGGGAGVAEEAAAVEASDAATTTKWRPEPDAAPTTRWEPPEPPPPADPVPPAETPEPQPANTPAADGVTVTGTPPKLQFGANDLVYGPSAGGKLRLLQQEAGGMLLNDIPKPGGADIYQFTKDTLDAAAASGRQVHFDLTYMKDLEGALAGEGKYANKVTSVELRHIRDTWDSYKVKPKFYKDGVGVDPPF